jgi:hypothetical protein
MRTSSNPFDGESRNKKHSSTACFLKALLCSRETYVRNLLTSKDMESLNMTFDKDTKRRGTSFLKWRNYSRCFFNDSEVEARTIGDLEKRTAKRNIAPLRVVF